MGAPLMVIRPLDANRVGGQYRSWRTDGAPANLSVPPIRPPIGTNRRNDKCMVESTPYRRAPVRTPILATVFCGSNWNVVAFTEECQGSRG